MPLRIAAAFLVGLSFLAEVGETQTCGGLILSLLAQGDTDQHDDGHQIGEHLEQLDVLAAKARNDQIDPEQQAEQVGTPDGVETAPGGEDDQSYSQPTQRFDVAVAAPGALDVVHGVVQAAHAGDAGAHAGGDVLVAGDVDTGGVCGGGVLAHGAQVQSGTGAIQEPRHDDGHHDGHVSQLILIH